LQRVPEENPSSDGNSSTERKVAGFLSQMDCNLLQDLYDVYWPDFLLFNYTMVEYQKMANGGKGCQLLDPSER
jgi:hypothetical protein